MKTHLMAKVTSIADCFFTHYKLPIPTREYKFHKDRKWRIDFAFVSVRLAIEMEGGIFTRGRHTRPMGFSNDIEKYNALTESGWILLRYPPNKVDFEQIYRVYQMLCIKLGWDKF
jgi:very-short-patch-repair endonuclease